MTSKKSWYLFALCTFLIASLVGCSGGGSSVTQTEQGNKLDIVGKVVMPKTMEKSLAAVVPTGSTVSVYDASTGLQLGASVPIDPNSGAFSGLTYTLAATKTILIYVADLGASGKLRYLLPIDLSNPPAGLAPSNPVSITIGQQSTGTVSSVSLELGLAGLLGDAGMVIPAAKTFADVSALVIKYNGVVLGYTANGIALTGKVINDALLPAQDASILNATQLNDMVLDGSITAVYIPGNKPVINFQVLNKTTGKGIRGLKTFNFAIAQLKPGATGSTNEWLSYMTTGSTRPGTESSTTGTAPNLVPTVGTTLIDNGDGSYAYYFAKDIKTGTGGTVTYDATLPHRLVVQIRATPSVALLASGATTSNFYNELILGTTFIPATPGVAPADSRVITATDYCNECHGKIGVTTPHGGRGDVKYCMVCHTAQRANDRVASTSVNGAFTGTTYVADGEVSGDFVTMIHKIHMGTKLTKTGYNYAGVLFNGITYPKDITNCRQCHKGDTAAQLALTPQGNNWKTKPSRKSCGSCHDNVNFVTGANLKAGKPAHVVQTDDSLCNACHTETYIENKHLTVNATPNNPNTATGLVNFYYDIASASVDAATNNLTIKYRIQQNTGSLSATKTSVVLNGTAANPLTGYTGGPSFLLAYYKDTPNQPAATSSADYNNLGVKAAQPKTVTVGSLLATQGVPDASGYYTATVLSASAFPVGATMRAVGLQGYFTQAAGTGGIAAATARHALSVVKEVTGDAKRRDVVDSAKCANCHEWFEGHGGNRVIGAGTVGQSICTLCHVPNLSTSGRGAQGALIDFMVANPVGTSLAAVSNFLTGVAFSGTVSLDAKNAMTALVASLGNNPTTYPETSNNFKDMVHGIHAGNDPLVVGTPLKFVRDRGTSGDFDYNFSAVKFPGVLKTCTMCHKGTTYTTMPVGVQVSTQVTTTSVPLVKQTAFPASVANGNNVTQVDLDRKSLPNTQDLVSSPFAATCKACHNRPNALAHFNQMGGKISQPRSTVNPADEACVTCHGTTGSNAIWNAHRFSTVTD